VRTLKRFGSSACVVIAPSNVGQLELRETLSSSAVAWGRMLANRWGDGALAGR